MQTGISQPSRSRQAAAAAEFAILLPFLAFVFLLAVDLCRAFYVTQVVQNCAYAGAMYASQVSASSSSPQTAAQQAAVAEVLLEPRFDYQSGDLHRARRQ